MLQGMKEFSMKLSERNLFKSNLKALLEIMGEWVGTVGRFICRGLLTPTI